jgi:hypothetical protein
MRGRAERIRSKQNCASVLLSNVKHHSSARGSPCVAKGGFAATNVRQACVRNGLRDMPNRKVGVAAGCAADGLSGAAITTDKSSEHSNRLVADLSAGIRGQHVDEVSHDLGHAKVLGAAPLAREPVQSDLADGSDGVA